MFISTKPSPFSFQSNFFLEKGTFFNNLCLYDEAIEVLTKSIEHNPKNREAYIHEQGTSLARILTNIPFELLASSANLNRIFSLPQHNQNNTSFTYLAISDIHGELLSEITAPGVIVPAKPVPNEPVL